ncbi:MAG: glucose-1-phosphate adenylyltransferase [Acidobacteriota bacterium]
MRVDMRDIVTLILGGGRGTRLFPLTHMRSKPAVPIGGKYRLIDVPISLCLHAGLNRVFVLTQFNSASLNRHIYSTYRLDRFSEGFVDILAAEQTPDNPDWYQGTADAVRQASRHFLNHEADYYLILAGDHLYRMDFSELIDAHVRQKADITIAAQPVGIEDAPAMGIFHFDRDGRISGFEEKPNRNRLDEFGSSVPAGASLPGQVEGKPFIASMGIYVFSRDVLQNVLSQPGTDFGKEIIPAALGRYRVSAYLYDGYWADVGTIRAFYDANIMLTHRGAPFSFFHPKRPIYTHPRFLPPPRVQKSNLDAALIGDGAYLDSCTVDTSVIGVRTIVRPGARITRSVLLGADTYEEPHVPTDRVPLGIGRNVVLDRVIVDKNARIGDGCRLTNEKKLETYDGNGLYIREGIVIVPKGAEVRTGTSI